jgi:hypothetical protein
VVSPVDYSDAMSTAAASVSGASAASSTTPAGSLPGRWRFLPPLALAWAILALVAAVAWWSWYWLSPAPVHRTPPPITDPVATIAASGFLNDGPQADPVVDAPGLPGDLRLLGTFAQKEGRGYALFRSASGARMVASGTELAPGFRLLSVAPDGVVVRDAGGEHFMALRAAALATPVTVGQATPATRTAARILTACTPPPGFHGNAVKLNAELLQGLLAQPDALKAIVQPVEGGMTVRSDSGFASMLGLKQGDRVRLANGIALATTEDVVAAVIRPLVANQPVRLTGTRGGQPQEMLLLNAGACP